MGFPGGSVGKEAACSQTGLKRLSIAQHIHSLQAREGHTLGSKVSQPAINCQLFIQ